MRVMATLIDHYLQEMRASISEAEQSEHTYAAVVDCYAEKYGEGVTADFKAASDPRLQKAIGDGAYYRDRATMYATSAGALRLGELVKRLEAVVSLLDEQRQRGAL